MIKENGLLKARKQLLRAQNILKRGSKKVYTKIGNIAVKFIVNRTLEGKDINGRKFKEYSPAYAAKKGYSQADLNLTGRLLKSIGRQAHQKYVRIYIKKTRRPGGMSNYQIAVVHNNGGVAGRGSFRMPIREFMGLTDEEMKILKDEFRKLILKEISLTGV